MSCLTDSDVERWIMANKRNISKDLMLVEEKQLSLGQNMKADFQTKMPLSLNSTSASLHCLITFPNLIKKSKRIFVHYFFDI